MSTKDEWLSRRQKAAIVEHFTARITGLLDAAHDGSGKAQADFNTLAIRELLNFFLRVLKHSES